MTDSGDASREALERRWRNSARCPHCATVPHCDDIYRSMCDMGSCFCRQCQHELMLVDLDILANSSASQFVGNSGIENLIQSRWHDTSDVEPDEFASGKHISAETMDMIDGGTHVGTLDSAIDRAAHQFYSQYYLYEFRIHPSTNVYPDLLIDSNAWSKPITMLADGTCDVIRYINRWEAMGDMSLIVHPCKLQLMEVRHELATTTAA